jgi:hypothetical protein
MATQDDKLNTGALATVLAVLAVSTLGIAAALTALVRYETQNHGAEKGVAANLRSYRELSTKQRATLTAEPAWVDKEKQLVAVPVERAMELTLQELRNDAKLGAQGSAGDAGAASVGDAGAAATGDGGLTENQVDDKSVDRELVGQPSGKGGVTPAEAVKGAEGKSMRDQDRPKTPGAGTPAPTPTTPAPQQAPGSGAAPTRPNQ